MADKIVLAYSGGLDTSAAIVWLKDKFGYDVIAMAADVGQGGDFDAVRERAIKAGAYDAIVVDCRQEYASEYILPALKANALYEGRYPLVSALSRPVIVRHMVEIARSSGAVAVAHGCTGKGNDQVRFEVSTSSLAPELEIVAPVRSWGMTREQCIEYLADRDINFEVTKSSPYSIDDNLWGRAIECGVLEDPWITPPDDVYELTKISATEPTEFVITFSEGVPVELDGKDMTLVDLISKVGQVVGSYGYGRLDMVENRRVGIKSREVYECPASLALIMAHQDLESITSERDLMHEKMRLEIRYGELVYDGLWFSPLRESLDAFMNESNRRVSGKVRIRCEAPGRTSGGVLGNTSDGVLGNTSDGTPGPGKVFVAGRQSPYSLYAHELATYGDKDSFRHQDSEGFVKLWGLGLRTWAQRSP